MLSLLLATILASPNAGEPLVLWHAWRGAESEALDQALAAQPIPVRAVAMPFEGFSEKISAALSHGEGPDLFIYPHDRLGQWRSEGALAALPDPSDALEAAALGALQSDGTLYGLPLASKALMLFGRGAATLPDDLLSARPSKPLIAADLSAYYQAFPWLAAAGARPFDPDERPKLASAEHARGVAQLKQLLDNGLISRGLDGAQAKAAFLRGQVPFLVDGPWSLDELSSAVPDLKIQAMPVVGGQPARPFVTVEAVFVSTHGRVEAAKRLAAFIASDAGAAPRQQIGKQLVPNRSLWTDHSDPLLRAAASATADTIPLPTTPKMRAFWGPAKDAITAVLRQGKEPEPALREASGRLKALLAPLPPRAAAAPWVVVLSILLLGAAIIVWRRWQAYRAPHDLPSAGTVALFVGPGLAALLLLVATPILTGVAMSFLAHSGGNWHLVGLANYGAIISAEGLGVTHPLSFWFTLFITVTWTVANLALHVGIGVALALLLNQQGLRLSAPFRVLLILPWAIPNYVTALAWRGLFDEQIGAINAAIELFGGSGLDWWDQPIAAFAANLTTNAWLGFPFMMVTALGALASLPADQIEAAKMDGASAWMRLRHIVLPQLLPAMVPAMLLGTIWTFNAFNVIYLVSGGDPAHSTDILVSEAYRWAFEGQGRYGYAAAYSVLIFGLLVLFGLASSKGRAKA